MAFTTHVHANCPVPGSGFGAFFAPGAVAVDMNALRDALRELPETVFADLLESDDAHRVVMDLPGATGDTVDISIDGARLRIEARREKSFPPAFSYVQEDRALFLDAELPLPPNATGEGATATMDGGVLTVTLPKRTAAGATRVPVEDA
jgi:HSP20 family molecular chaperone IbpA